jgi:hypothetical protein
MRIIPERDDFGISITALQPLVSQHHLRANAFRVCRLRENQRSPFRTML